MRKQLRTKAFPRVLAMAGGLMIATVMAAPTPAGAQVLGQAPPTATNFARLRMCEASGNYAINTGNGYYGAYQFSLTTWWSLGYRGYPNQASSATQDQAAARLQAIAGWGPWPGCSRYLGLR